jgi:hypothetical protein
MMAKHEMPMPMGKHEGKKGGKHHGGKKHGGKK